MPAWLTLFVDVGLSMCAGLMFQSLHLLNLYPGDSKCERYAGRIHCNLALVYFRMCEYKNAEESASRALRCPQPMIESNLVLTKSLFRMMEFQRGHQVLLATLACNECTDDQSLDLVESCCDLLDLNDLNLTPDEREKRVQIMKEAYGKMQERHPTYEQTIVSQLRTMIKYELLTLAIQHLDRSHRHIAHCAH